jgi:pimeloyl-ACP methyl ester carboxylesterase
MQVLVKASLAVALMLIVSASSSAQPQAAIDSCADMAVRKGPPQPPACFDGTPHKRSCVQVDKGVKLQVLDWGGADKPDTMVLLAGYGDTAHVFDEFAYQFTDNFHVIGITRRGFLPSSQPKSGYDVETRAHDDIEVLKYLGISKAVFVGHSLAGSELSELGLKYHGYVEKLVYLDSLDLAKRFERPEIPGTPYVSSGYSSLQLFQAAQARLEDTVKPVWSLCPGLQFGAKGAVTDSSALDWVRDKIFAGVAEKQNPEVNWADIDAPRLGIFDQPSVQGKLPFYWYLSSDEQKVFDANWPGIVQWFADTTERFERPNAGKPTPVVYLLPDAPHYFFINDQAFVVRRMREFLLGKSGP